MLALARRLLVVGLALAMIIPAATPAAAVTTWTGKVLRVFDGDTFEVKLGNGKIRRVRMTGIQAMELSDYERKVGDCHAPEAELALRRIILGKTVRLKAVRASSLSYGRDIRYVEIKRAGKWRDVNLMMLKAGHALWAAHEVENLYGRKYQVAAVRAANRGTNLWDTDYCKAGPAQAANLKMWVNWDAEGADNSNINGEWVKIRNTHPTLTVPVGGWIVRDSSLRNYGFFKFPGGAAIAPGETVTVHVGSGANRHPTYYWNMGITLFENVTATPHVGDGAYLLDRDGDLRSWFMYPCVVGCTDPNAGNLKLAVNWDAERDDANNPNGEWVDVRNTGLLPIDLEPYLIKAGDAYSYPLDGLLLPATTLRLHIGRGPDTDILRHWNKPEAILPNNGGKVELRTYTNVRLDCYRWGSAAC